MSTHHQNYWQTTVHTPREAEQPIWPAQVDVAVIGAGYAGLSAARTLARGGASVAVLEAESIGWGASSRNGGMVLSGLKQGVNQLISTYGRERVQRLYAASLAAIDFVEALVGEENINCGFERTGHLGVACKRKHFEDYSRQAEVIAREFQHTLRVVPQAQLGEEIGSGIYFGGMVDPISAAVNPAQYVAGLACGAVRAGAQIFERSRMLSVTARQGARGWRLTTARGELWAAHVFAATGAYTGPATPALRRKMIPIGSYIIATEVLPADLAHALSPRRRMIYDSKNYLHYYRVTHDRRLLFGGRAAFFPESEATVRRSAEILRKGMIGVYPQLRDTKVEYVWGGTIDFTFDTMPHSGEMEGMHYTIGFAGHGVAMASYQGHLMAQSILGKSPDNPFAGLPFPGAPLGLYDGRPWFLPFAGAYYKLLDWVS